MLAVVDVLSSDDDASESGDNGQFLITLDAPEAMPLVVNYSLSGTADNGDDYELILGSVEIPMGETSVAIDVAPLSDSLNEGSETVVLTLEEDPSFYYQLGTNTSATVTIADDAGGGLSVDAGADAAASEGTSFSPDFTFSDDEGQSWTANVNFGDGSAPATIPLTAVGTFSRSHTYADDGQYTVTVTVTADDDRTASDTLQVTVNNAVPVVNAGADAKVAAGATWSQTGLFADPGADTWTATVDYGDGGGPQSLTLHSAKTFALAHAYEYSGSYAVTVTVADDDGGEGVDTLTVTVNAPPSLDLDADDSGGAYGSGFNATFVEDAGAVLLADADATVSDADDTQLAGVTVTLSNRQSPEEVLTVNTAGTSIQAAYAGGVLRLTGTAPLAQYEQVLRTLRYNNTAHAMIAGDRRITVVANDGLSNSEPATVTVAVALVNDAPVAATGALVVGKDTYTQLVLGEDGDGEVTQRLTLTIVTPPAHATLGGFDPLSGTVWFTPHLGYTGPDSFSYYLTDDDGAGAPAALTSATVTRSVTIQRLNNSPEADAQELGAQEDTPLSISLTGDDGEDDLVQTLTFAIVTAPAHGTLSNFNPATGAVTYTPDPNYVGEDGFSFAVTDDATVGGPALESDTAVIAITVAGVNDSPVATSQTVGVGQSTPTTIALGNDGDPETDQTLTLNVTSGPAHGTLSGFNPLTGQVTYTPAAGYQGSDVFSYTLTDSGGLTSAPATVTLAVSSAPTAGAQSQTTAEDTLLALALTGDDGDATAVRELTFSVVSGPAHGTLEGLDPLTGQVNYRPSADFHGSDSFTYRVSYTTATGAVVQSPPATVSLTMTAVNDVPLENVEQLTIGKDEATTVTLGSDGDPEAAQQLTLTIITPPAHGTLSGFNPATGEALYTPDEGYVGVDGFQFTQTDDATAGGAALVSATGEINFVIRTRPAANAQSHEIAEDAPLNVGLTSSPGGSGTLTYRITTQPSHGTLSDFNPAAGTATYTPEADYHGTDSFSFVVLEKGPEEDSVELSSSPATISLTISAVNDQPQGAAQELSLAQGQEIDVSLAGDDDDPEVEQTLTYAIATQPEHGTIEDFDPETGTLRYVPDPGYDGPDSFSFTVTDDTTAGGGGAQTSEPAVVSLTIGAPPTGGGQSVSTAEDTPLAIVLTGQDGDAGSPAALKFLIVTPPVHGSLTSFNSLTGAVLYQPDPNYVGSDSFEFAVVDDLAAPGLSVVGAAATVTIAVTAVNDAPIAHTQEVAAAEGNATRLLLGHDGDADLAQSLTLTVVSAPGHGTLSGFDQATGAVIYTPAAGYTGPDSFTFTLTDNGSPSHTSAAATVSITVATVNHTPTAAAQSVTLNEDGSLGITLSGDDGDSGATQVLRYEIVAPPAHGTISGFDPATGTLTYTPEAGYHGPDSFRFVVVDDDSIAGGGELASEAGVVAITVAPVNDAPTAEAVSLTLLEDQPIQVQLTGDDGDPLVYQALTFVFDSQPAWGTISNFDAVAGHFTYTPDANYSGNDSFSYHVIDDASAGGAALVSATKSVLLSITAAHQSVLAMPLAASTQAGTSAGLTLPTTGSTGPAPSLIFAIVTGPANGTLSGLEAATGAVTYTPNSGYTGADSFTFSVTDERAGQTTTASVQIEVSATGTTTAADDDYTVRASDGAAILDVLANDTRAAGGTLSIVAFSAPATGTLELIPATPSASGPEGRDRLRFTPASGQTGAISFTYTAEGTGGQQSTADVNLTLADSGTVATDGELAIGGGSFNADPDSTFVRPVTGNINTSRTSTTLFTRSWTDPTGEERNGNGTQTNTVTITAAQWANGNWTYVEVGTWTYDIFAGDVHVWGNYHYTFNAGFVAGVEYFFFTLTTDDNYASISTQNDGTAESGSTTTITSGGNQHQWLFKSKVTNVAGTLAQARMTNTGRSNYSSSRSYWYATPGGGVSGSGSGNGSTNDFMSMNVTLSVPAIGPSTVTGAVTGNGSGNNSSQYIGAGTYVQDVINGTINENGNSGNNFSYSLSGSLQPNLEWSLSGSGSQSGSGGSSVIQAGAGTKTTSGSADGGTWTQTSNLSEGGSQRNQFRSSMNLSLTATGWTATGGVASATGTARSYFTHSGSGTYTKSSSSPTEVWSLSGTSTENGGETKDSTQTTVSTYNGTAWSTVGSGSASGSSSFFRSFSGSGTYTQAVLDSSGAVTGSIGGNRWESGSTRKSNSNQTISALINGAWVAAGTASGSSEVRSQGSYSGSGSYVHDRVTRSAKQNGSNEGRTSNESHWTMPAGGSWTLSSGSGSSMTKSDTFGSYSGSGTYSETTSSGMSGGPAMTGSGGGNSWSNASVTRWDYGSEENHFSTDSQLQVVAGQWKLVSGTGSGSGKSDTSSSNSSQGSYGYTTPNISVTGSHSGAGGNSLHTDYTVNSTYDPSASSGAGDWITSGNSSGSDSYSGRADSSGSGTWNLSVSSGGMASTGSGTVNEDNHSHEDGSGSWTSTLSGGSDSWVLSSGSASTSGGGNNNWSLSASGTYHSAGYLRENWGSFTIQSEKHDSHEFNSQAQVVGNVWKNVGGSASASGSSHDLSSRSGTGTISVEKKWGFVTYRTGNSTLSVDDVSYQTNSTVGPDGQWQTTGTAVASSSGSNMSSNAVNKAKYQRQINGGTINGFFDDFEIHIDFQNFTANYSLAANGDWTLTSGSGSSYAGDGVGQAFSGRGTYSLGGTTVYSDGLGGGWSINGTVKEGGGWDATEGEGSTHGVSSGSIVVLSTSSSGTDHEFSSFSNSASGSYWRGGISGSFSRSEDDSFDAFFVFSRTGSTSGSGSGSAHEGHTYKWSYSGGGAYSHGGTTGTLQESGSGNFQSNQDDQYSRSGSGSWIQTSGSAHIGADGRTSVEYSGSASFGGSGSGIDGSAWAFNGTRTLSSKQESWFNDSDDWQYQSGAWSHTQATYKSGDKTKNRDGYSGAGTYTEILPGGTVSGSTSASGFNESEVEFKETQALAGGKWSHTGSGTGRSERETHWSYSGSGNYSDGGLTGTFGHHGEHHESGRGDFQYRLAGTKWQIKGEGTSAGSGEDAYSFSGSGSYTKAIPGGTLTGTHSEAGGARYAYGESADWKLGVGQQWVLVSGTGFSEGSGSYQYSSSGSGSYTKSFDGDGVLSGTYSESGGANWQFDYRFDSEVVDRAWTTTGSGSESGSSYSSFSYSGSGTRSHTTTTPNGSSQDTSTLSEAVGGGYSSQFTFEWNEDADGVTWNYDSTATGSGSGMYDYSASGSSSYTYSDGNYAGGNGTISSSSGSYQRHDREDYQWQETTEYHEDYAEGEITSWSDSTGSGSATGLMYRFNDGNWSSQSRITSTNYSREESHASGSGSEATDNYNVTANWSHSVGSDGSQSYDATVSNHVWGDGESWWSYSEAWTETYSYSGTGSGSGGGGSSTTSGGSNGSGNSPFGGYDQTVSQKGFYSGAYNNPPYGWGIGGLPVSGSYSYYMPGDPGGGGGSGSGSGGGGGTTPPDPLAGGPWFDLLGGDGDVSGTLLVDLHGVLHQGAGGSTTFEDILGIKEDIPDPPSPYGNAFHEFLGENVIRPIVGDELLAGASDFELFMGTAIFATVLVVGIWVAPGAVAAGAAFGAVIGAGYSIAHQLDNGATWDTLDWGQVGRGALAGAVGGAFMGAAMGIGGALIPGFCYVEAVLAGVGAASSFYNAYNNFNEGNNYTATLDATLGVLGALRAAGGGCFVAGTQVVVYIAEPEPETVALAAAEGEWNRSLLAGACGTFLIAAWIGTARLRRARKRRDDETARRILFNALDRKRLDEPAEDEELLPGHGEVVDGDGLHLPAVVDEGRLSPSQLDELCDQLFDPQDDWEPALDPWSSASPLGPSTAVLERPRTTVRRDRRSPARERIRDAARLPRESTRRGGMLAMWVCTLALSGLLCLLAAPWNSWRSDGQRAAAPAQPRRITKNIEEIRLGDWVLAANPELTDAERQEAEQRSGPGFNPAAWRSVSLRLHKDEGGYVDMELLRPLSWVRDHELQVGGQIELEVEEMGASGWAHVWRIDACPPIGPPPGEGCRVVTGRFVHPQAEVLDVCIAGLDGQPDETIGVTPNHPVWSEDEEEFIPAGELLVGELLLTATGQYSYVRSITPRELPETVYNLEVDVEHVFFVSPAGLLVHNAKPGCGGAKRGPKTTNRSPHNKKIAEIRKQLEAKGYKIISGGRKRIGKGKYAKEGVIKTPGGHRETRRPDILYENKSGKLRAINVGKTTAKGKPVPREVKAKADLEKKAKIPTKFEPYDR